MDYLIVSYIWELYELAESVSIDKSQTLMTGRLCHEIVTWGGKVLGYSQGTALEIPDFLLASWIFFCIIVSLLETNNIVYVG